MDDGRGGAHPRLHNPAVDSNSAETHGAAPGLGIEKGLTLGRRWK
jgi:hypothetical protein